jgi:parallel beta-helix repeat protein
MALNVRIIESGGNGVSINAASYDCTILNCLILNCDAAGIMSNGPRNKIIGSTVYNAGTYGIQLTDTGDNTVVTGNIVEGSAGVSVFVNDSAANVVVVGNRLDGAVTEGSGGTLEAGLNNENTF